MGLTYYVAVDIGCIECGEASALLGVFAFKIDAERACTVHRTWQKANWHGQHEFVVFECNKLNEIAPLPQDEPEVELHASELTEALSKGIDPSGVYRDAFKEGIKATITEHMKGSK